MKNNLIFIILFLAFSLQIFADEYVEPDTNCCWPLVNSTIRVSKEINDNTTQISNISKDIKALNSTIQQKKLICPEVKKQNKFCDWCSILGAFISGIVALIIFILGYLINRKSEKDKRIEILNEIKSHVFSLINQIIESVNIQVGIINDYTGKINKNPYQIIPIAKFNHSDLDRLLMIDTNEVRQIFVKDDKLGLETYIKMYRDIDHLKGSLGEIFSNLTSYTNSEIRDLMKQIVQERNVLMEIIQSTSTETLLVDSITDILEKYNSIKSISVNVETDFEVLVKPLHHLFSTNPPLIEAYIHIFNQNRKIGNLITTLAQMNMQQMNHMEFEAKELEKTNESLKKIWNKNAPQQQI